MTDGFIRGIKERLANVKHAKSNNLPAIGIHIKYFADHAEIDIANLLEEREVLQKALKSYAADSFDSATSLADHDFMGYGATARAALAWKPSK